MGFYFILFLGSRILFVDIIRKWGRERENFMWGRGVGVDIDLKFIFFLVVGFVVFVFR